MATLKIDQTLGAGGAADNEALDEAWLGQEVKLTLSAGTQYEHAFLVKPEGSSAVIANPTSQEATFIPDVAARTYLVRSKVKVAGKWQTIDKTITVTKDAAGVDVNYGLAAPAPKETPSSRNPNGSERGYGGLWERNIDRIVAAIDTATTEAIPASGDPTGETDRTQLQALIDAGESFKLVEGVYYLDQCLIVDPDANDIRIDFGNAELRPGSAWVAGGADDRTNSLIRIAGAATGSVNTTLAATEPMGSLAIMPTSATGFADGVFLKISGKNNTAGFNGRTDTVDVSEIVELAGGGSPANLEGALAYHHDIGHTVVSWNPARNIEIIGGYLNGSASTVAVGLEITDAYNITIRGTSFRGFSRAPIDEQGSKRIYKWAITNRGDCNGFVWSSTSHDTYCWSPVATGEFGRQHASGTTRHQFWFLNHCVNAVVSDATLHKVAAVMAVWGGINCGGSGWRVDDVDCTEVVNRADADERQSGMVGIVYEGGPGPINDFTCFGYGSFMRDGVFTNLHQPTLNGQKWAYAHDQFQVDLANLTVINRGQSPMDSGGYLGGMLISDFSGTISNINTCGTYRAIETNNFLVDVLIDNYRAEAYAGVGTTTTQYGLHIDHHQAGSSIKIGTIELVSYQGVHQFGSSWGGAPDYTFVWDTLRFESETFRNIVPVRTNSIVARGTIGHMQDPTVSGYDAVIEATGPNAKQCVFLGAHLNNWTFAALGDAVALHTGAAANRSDLLVADALGNLVVNNAPPNDAAIFMCRQASAGGRVHVVRIGSSPAFGTLTASTSVRAPAFTSASGDTVIRALAGQKVSVYEDTDKVFDAYYSAADSARRVDFPDTTLINSANILVLRVAASGRLQSPSLRNQFYWDDSGPTIGHDATQKVILNILTASTVGAAGGASALPATPSGYARVTLNGVAMKIPYYAD